MILIREANPEDLMVLRDLFYTIRKEEFAWETQAAQMDFDSSTKGEIIYTAVMNDVIVGFISIWEADCFVHNLFVRKDVRKCGIGSALLAYARERHPQKPLTLKCVKENQAACQFYSDHGWSMLEDAANEKIPYFLMEWDIK